MSKRAISRRKSRGQNLVELALSLPFIIVMCFFIMELGRAWHTYEAAKMAANEGAHTAAIHHNQTTGQNALDQRLTQAKLTVVNSQVRQVNGQHAYEANVTVKYTPAFGGGFRIPTLSGGIQVVPDSFDISYTAITENAVY